MKNWREVSCEYCNVSFSTFASRKKFCSEKCLSKKDGKLYYKRYEELCKAKSKAYKEANRNYYLNYLKEYRQNNKEQGNAQKLAWTKRNRGYCTANTAKYRAEKDKRTPKWLTKEHIKQIAQIYKEADRLSKELGIKMTVDHIIPLRGKDISGLHVPTNLQIIPFADNCRKSNKYE